MKADGIMTHCGSVQINMSSAAEVIARTGQDSTAVIVLSIFLALTFFFMFVMLLYYMYPEAGRPKSVTDKKMRSLNM